MAVPDTTPPASPQVRRIRLGRRTMIAALIAVVLIAIVIVVAAGALGGGGASPGAADNAVATGVARIE